MSTQVFKSIDEWMEQRREIHDYTLGFVPTMGALHSGHRSLIERSSRENERTVVSIFVNPTQFNDPKDLDKYPRTYEKDLELLETAGADYLIYPRFDELYPDQYRYRLQETEFSKELCGAHRPGHFDGVLTVVMKLLNIVQARRAYFGEKDYQQLLLIQGMVRAFFHGTEIIPCETVREADGLAMSSRNVNLSPQERELAPYFAKLLRSELPKAEIQSELEKAGFRVDYIEEKFGRRFGAVFLGSVRLIDNVRIEK